MSEENLKLWNAVGKTNPADTKHINQRGGFTAIDAYSQIKAATAQFGPAGSGWGWAINSVQTIGESVVVVINMWTKDGISPGFGVCGQADTMTRPRSGTPYPDTDAVKKALTDAITKGLSYLGFNNDVFTGRFDDSKYVAERLAENTPPPAEPPPPPTDPERLVDMIPTGAEGAVSAYLGHLGWLEPGMGINNLPTERKALIISGFDRFMAKVRTFATEGTV